MGIVLIFVVGCTSDGMLATAEQGSPAATTSPQTLGEVTPSGSTAPATRQPESVVEMPVVTVVARSGVSTRSEPRIEPTNEATATHPQDDRFGGTLKVEFGGLFIPDPHALSNFDSAFLHAEIYSGLTRMVDRAESTIELDLAESYSVSDGGLKYQFRLRSDLKFSDGSPLTSSDFKWSWERALARAPRSSVILGDIDGARAVIDGETRELSGVTIIDDRNLEVKLAEANADFLARLADPVGCVLKRSNVENWGFDWSRWYSPAFGGTNPFSFDELPIGTGPFALIEFDVLNHGQVIISRNPYYWEGPAFLERVRFAPFGGNLISSQSEFDEEESRFQRGELHITGTSKEGYQRAIANPNSNDATYDVHRVARRIELLVLNPLVEPMSDTSFRRALAFATDVRPALDAQPNGANGSGVALTSPGGDSGLEPAFGILTDDVATRGSGERTNPFNLGIARTEIAKSAYDSGFSLQFFDTVGQIEDVLTIASIWRDVLAVTLEAEEIEYGVLQQRIASNRLQLMRISITPRYPDPAAVLNVFQGLFGDDTGVDEIEQLEDMLSSAQTESDASLRIEAFSDVEQFILENAIAIPLTWSNGQAFVRLQPWIMGYEPSKYYGSRYKTVWFDKSHPDYVSSDNQ